jgi:hypothetical protein
VEQAKESVKAAINEDNSIDEHGLTILRQLVN